MKDNGKMIQEVGKEWNVIQTEIAMKENFRMESRMERAFTPGLMEKYMKVNGLQVSKRGKESGKAFLATHTLENGSRAKLMATGFINGRMEIVTKENGTIA